MRSGRTGVAAITAAVVAAVSTVVWSLPSAAAAPNPPPPASLASEVIDAHLGYMPQARCSPSAKPGAKALLRALIATWGGGSSGISRACSVGATSEHKEGRALDWHMDVRNASQRARVKRALDWLTANHGEVAYRLGVMYVIWNQRIWSLYYPELGWRKMPDRGSYTANHKNHVHISLSWDGAYQQTSWWTGVPVTAPLNSRCGVGGAPACLPTIARTTAAWPYQHTEVPASFLPFPWTEPAIGGGPQVGRTLTVVPGTWVPEGSEVSVQWLAGATPIPGATAPTLELSPDLLGRAVRVRVTAGGTTKTSDGTIEVVKGRFDVAPVPEIVGNPSTDVTVRVDPGAWSPQPDSVTIAWRRNGRVIAGATGESYTPQPSDVGTRLTVTVTARRAGFTTASATSAGVRVGEGVFTSVPVPTVSGDAVVGGTLTADPGAWFPAATLRYQWYADGAAIRTATGRTYSPSAERAGAQVQVRVAGSRRGYTTVFMKSAPVTVGAG